MHNGLSCANPATHNQLLKCTPGLRPPWDAASLLPLAKALGGYGLRIRGYLGLALAIAAPISFAWECPGDRKNYELEYNWDNSSLVYVATVMKGWYSPKEEYPYRYKLKIEESFKPIAPVELSINGDSSIQLALGGKYVFFANSNTLDACNIVLPFDRQWIERDDVPAKLAYVEKILELAGKTESP